MRQPIVEKSETQQEWNQARIEQYIEEQIEEGLNLEYKGTGSLGRSNGKKREITKDVSAMANSDGGIILFGVAEHQEADKKHLSEMIDPVDRTHFPKEWLEQIVNTIRPKLMGVRIHPVSINDDPNQVVYAIEIPQSTTAHQARDYRYYKRHNFQSVPMEDYEIRDVMNRAIMPNAAVEFSYKLKIEGRAHAYTLLIRVRNTGTQVIDAFKLRFAFPNYGSHITCRTFRPDHPYGRIEDPEGTGEDITVVFCSRNPLFPEDEVEIGKAIGFEYTINEKAWAWIRSREHDMSLRWVLYADNMRPKQGEIPFAGLNRY